MHGFGYAGRRHFHGFPSPGVRLSYEEYLRDGTVTFLMVKYQGASLTWLWSHESGTMYSASVQINKRHKSENGV